MAERFTGQRCEDCQGGLQYNKKDKYWECPYCGKIYERELRFNKVQIDGLAGVNDVVRSTLRKLVSLDFDAAEKDLAECEKLDHASVGTLIANLSFLLFKSFFVKERQQYMAKLNVELQKMNKEFPEMEEEERQLYDFIDSNDIYALLVVVYGSLKMQSRQQYLSTLLDPEEVFEPNVARYLLSVYLKNGETENADILIKNIVEKNCKVGLLTVMNSYPACPKKGENIEHILEVAGSEADFGKLFDSYFSATADDNETVIAAFLAALSHGVSFNTSAVIDKVFESCTDSDAVRKIFESFAKKRLDEHSTSVILNWCLYRCEDIELCALGLRTLFESNSLFEMEDGCLRELLFSSQLEEQKLAKLELMFKTFKISNKNVDKVLTTFLLEVQGSREFRLDMLRVISAHTSSVPLSVLEKYVLTNGIDGEYKGEILAEIFKKSTNLALSKSLFESYLRASVDSPEAREGIISQFLGNRVVPDSQTFNTYLLNKRELHSDELLDKFVAAGCRAAQGTLDAYLSGANTASYNSKIVSIAMGASFYISGDNLVKYVMFFSEVKSVKIQNVKRMLEACRDNLRDKRLTAAVAGQKLNANLTQAYFLTSADEAFVIQEIVKLLESAKIKTDVPVQNLADGKKLKLRKFVELYSEQLDKKVTSLASEIL